MNLSVWRDVRSQNGGRSRSGDVIVGLCDGNRIWRVSPDTHPWHWCQNHAWLVSTINSNGVGDSQAGCHSRARNESEGCCFWKVAVVDASLQHYLAKQSMPHFFLHPHPCLVVFPPRYHFFPHTNDL